MTRRPIFLYKRFLTLLAFVAIFGMYGIASGFPKWNATGVVPINTSLNHQGDDATLAAQVKELQKKVTELQSQLSELKSPRIIAAGTTTIKLGRRQDNKTSLRVKLPDDIVAQLGGKCIVQLTNRYPTGGSYFVPYWRQAIDGFDIFVANPALIGIGIINDNEPYYIDWIVVQK